VSQAGGAPEGEGTPGALSITEVRNALRCPRVFALGRARGQAVVFPVGSSALGATFHRLVERFFRLLDAPPAAFAALPAGAPRAQLEAELTAFLIDEVLVPELRGSAIYAAMPSEVDDLAEALRQYAAWLAAALEAGAQASGAASEAPALALARLARASELPVDTVLPGGITLRGRIDALLVRPGGEVEVVEYKLTSDESDELDRAQVALYRFLLRQKHDIDAQPTVLRFTPQLRETRLAPAEADALVASRLLPLVGQMAGWLADPSSAPATTRPDLCGACPMRFPCASTYPGFPPRDQPPASSNLPRPDALGQLAPSFGPEPPPREPGDPRDPRNDDGGPREALELGRRVLEELKRRGVAAKISRVAIGPRLLRLELAVSYRQSVRDLDREAASVEHQLATAGPTQPPSAEQGAPQVSYQRKGARRFFLAQRAHPRAVELIDLLRKKEAWLRARPGRFVVGEGEGGDAVAGDLSDGGSNHVLIGGQTGSGKSVLLRALLIGMAHHHGPEAIRFTLVDPKLVTFDAQLAAQLGPHLDGPVVHKVDELLPRLAELEAEMYARLERFSASGVQDITAFNELAPEQERLPRLVLVVDEFQDLASSKATQKAFLEGVHKLGAMARAPGIHLLLATQHPTVATVPTGLKANLTGRIALRVTSAVNSRVILDEAGAEALLGRGDLLCNLGQGLVRAQAPMA
jgi:DNA segregation ATPase FtsK/SpoIIIE, S-DNA-T family